MGPECSADEAGISGAVNRRPWRRVAQLHHYVLGGPATVAKTYLTANTIKVGNSCISLTTKLITNSIRGDDGSMKSQGVETHVHTKARATLGDTLR
jgi:hypothetical protein